jgi:DNA-binding CsgD family transcriptional regulator
MGIHTRDLGRAIRLIDDHVLPPDGDPFGREMLRELADLISADYAEFFELRERDKAGLEYVTTHDQPDPPAATEEGYQHYRTQNPLGAFKWQPADGVVRLSSLVSERELRDLPLFEFYWGHHGIRDQLKLWLRRGQDSAVCLNLDRNGGTFTDRDVALLQVLRPHLLRAHTSRVKRSVTPRNEVALTRREAEVLSLAAVGDSNSEIAAALSMSPGTVRKHLERAYEKLGVRSRSQAVAVLRQAAAQHHRPAPDAGPKSPRPGPIRQARIVPEPPP